MKLLLIASVVVAMLLAWLGAPDRSRIEILQDGEWKHPEGYPPWRRFETWERDVLASSKPVLVARESELLLADVSQSLLWQESFDGEAGISYGRMSSGCPLPNHDSGTLLITTEDDPYCASRFFHPGRWQLESFEFALDYRACGGSEGLADGLTIAFVKDEGFGGESLDPAIDSGGALAYEGLGGFAVEIDLFHNHEYDPPGGAHIAILVDSVQNHLAVAPAEGLADGRWHRIAICYDQGSVSVLADGEVVLDWEPVEPGAFCGYIVLTGATGGLTVRQEVDALALYDSSSRKALAINSTPEGASVYLDGIYSGQETPCALSCYAGCRIGFGLDGYLYREIDVFHDSVHVELVPIDQPLPNAGEWRILLLVAKNTQAAYVKPDGTTGHASESLPEEAVQAVLEVVPEYLEGAILEYTWGAAVAEVQVQVVDTPITKVTSLSPPGENYWVAPSDIEAILDRYAPDGAFDTVIVYWAAGEIPVNGQRGLALLHPTEDTNEAGYVDIVYVDTVPDWVNDQMQREIWLHEWLHTIETHFQLAGCDVPTQGADGGGSHSYESGGSEAGWSGYYRDLMTGRVEEDGRFTGFTPEAWLLFGTNRDDEGS